MSRADEERWLADATVQNGFANGMRLAIETKDGAHIGSIGLHRLSPQDRHAGLAL